MAFLEACKLLAAAPDEDADNEEAKRLAFQFAPKMPEPADRKKAEQMRDIIVKLCAQSEKPR